MSSLANPRMSPISQLAYKARGKAARPWIRGSHAFSVNGVPGVSLAEALGGGLSLLDGRDDYIFEGLGRKVTYHLMFPGHKPFTRQKWNKCTKDGKDHPVTREKIAVLVAQVLRTFMDSAQDAADGGTASILLESEYVPFEEFYLLQLEQYGSSVQPVFGRCRAQDVTQPASPAYEAVHIPQSQTTSPVYEAVSIPQPASYHHPVLNVPRASFLPPTPLDFPEAVKPVDIPSQNWIFDPGDGFGSGIPYDAKDFSFEWNDSGGSASLFAPRVEEPLVAQDLVSSLSGLTLEQPFGTYPGDSYGYYNNGGADAFEWSF